jgi:hypothetical protein
MSEAEAKALCDLFKQLLHRASALPDGSEELQQLARELVQRARPLWESRPRIRHGPPNRTLRPPD